MIRRPLAVLLLTGMLLSAFTVADATPTPSPTPNPSLPAPPTQYLPAISFSNLVIIMLAVAAAAGYWMFYYQKVSDQKLEEMDLEAEGKRQTGK